MVIFGDFVPYMSPHVSKMILVDALKVTVLANNAHRYRPLMAIADLRDYVLIDRFRCKAELASQHSIKKGPLGGPCF